MDFESVSLVKHEVFMYQIPPRTSNRGYKAADWKLDAPDWTGRLKVVTKGHECTVRLEDKNSGQLFAECPIESYPGIAVEAVSDSSRYFVIRVQDGSGKAAFIGIGFADRSDSFDFNVALQDHFKWVEKQKNLEEGEQASDAQPQKDLSFQPGQTIKINLDIARKGRPKPKEKSAGGMGPGGALLPPPPGMKKVAAAPSVGSVAAAPVSSSTDSTNPFGSVVSTNSASSQPSNSSLLLDFDFGAPPAGDQVSSSTAAVSSAQDLLADFGAVPDSVSKPKEEPTTPDWVTF